jgi:DNA modification methylase
MRWLIRLVTPVNGLVLEPFLGSGTTGVASSLEGFRSIGIERDSDYADICIQRISHAEGAEIVEIDKLKIERLEEETWPEEQS